MAEYGKRIKQVANERWDLNDGAQALAELIYDVMARAEAGDLGVAEGVLSRSEISYVAPYLHMGSCLLYGCKSDSTSATNLATAQPVVYKTTDPDQLQSTLDISSLTTNGTGAIWWQVAEVETDLENRRVWQAGYPDGTNQAMNTRLKPRVVFELTTDFDTPPAFSGIWYRFAAVAVVASVPTVVLCHALDYGFENQAIAVASAIAAGDTTAADFWLGQLALANRSATTNSGRSYSVARLLTMLSQLFLRTLDSSAVIDLETGEITTTPATTLATAPSSGVVQLDASMTAVEFDVNSLQTDVADLQVFRPIFGCTIDAAGNVTQERPFSTIVSSPYGGGTCRITFNNVLPSGSRIDYTSFPFVTCRSNNTYLNAYWESQYVLIVKSKFDAGYVNEPFYLTIIGSYA